MFRRIFNFLLLTVMIVGAGVTYDMKHKAEIAADRNARLEAEIARDKDAVQLLRAEWSLLTQPSRLSLPSAAVLARADRHHRRNPDASGPWRRHRCPR